MIKHSDEFKQEAVRIALTSGLPRARVAADLGVGKDFFGRSGSDHNSARNDEGAAANPERFANIVVRNEHADALGRQFPNDALDVDDGQGVDACKRLVEQDETRFRRQRPRNFDPPTLAARK